MFSFLTTPGFTDEVIHSFMATGLTTGEKHLEADEFSEVVTFKLSHALRMIQTNEIRDAKTALIILYAAGFGAELR
jgi:ADP-ribose pyrophosphatase